MKRISLICLFLGLSSLAYGQGTALPNISYSAILTATCANTNTACTNGIVAGAGGVPSLPQANSGPLGNGATLDVPVANYNAATVTVQGAYTGSTINFEFSDSTGGVFYFQEVCARTDINLLEVTEVLPSNQTRAWQCPVWGGYRFRVRQSALSTGSVNITITLTQAAIDPSLVVAASITNIAGASDPCQDVSAIKSSTFQNITTATTTALVAPSGATTIYVCGVSAELNSTATPDTLLFEQGTGAACVTSPTAISATYANGSGTTVVTSVPIVIGDGAATVLRTSAGGGLCAVTTVGTGPSIPVTISYVQQ